MRGTIPAVANLIIQTAEARNGSATLLAISKPAGRDRLPRSTSHLASLRFEPPFPLATFPNLYSKSILSTITMADAGCSGSRPFKGLINHQDHDRSLPSLTTRPSASPNVGFLTSDKGHPAHVLTTVHNTSPMQSLRMGAG